MLDAKKGGGAISVSPGGCYVLLPEEKLNEQELKQDDLVYIKDASFDGKIPTNPSFLDARNKPS